MFQILAQVTVSVIKYIKFINLLTILLEQMKFLIIYQLYVKITHQMMLVT